MYYVCIVEVGMCRC